MVLNDTKLVLNESEHQFDIIQKIQRSPSYLMQPQRIYLDATPRIYQNHVAGCQQRITTAPDIYIPWRPIQRSGKSINKPVANQHPPRALLYTQYSAEKYIYIINFAYITTTTIYYERRPIRYAREDPWSRYTRMTLMNRMNIHKPHVRQ